MRVRTPLAGAVASSRNACRRMNGSHRSRVSPVVWETANASSGGIGDDDRRLDDHGSALARLDLRAGREQVQAQRARQVAGGQAAADAVAGRVEAGGERARLPLPGATVTMPPDTPLLPGRPMLNSHSPERSYRPLVARAASTYRHTDGVDHALAGDRVDAAVGEGGAHDGEVGRGDEQGALPRVDVGGLQRVVRDAAVALQQPGDGLVAAVVGRLGGVHVVVEHQRAARERGQAGLHERPLVGGGRARDEAGGGQGAGVDQRVHRAAAVELERHHGVEREAGVVHADLRRAPPPGRARRRPARTRTPWTRTGSRTRAGRRRRCARRR